MPSQLDTDAISQSQKTIHESTGVQPIGTTIEAHSKDLPSENQQMGDADLTGLRRLQDIEKTTTKWLFHPYIPVGKITYLDGDPGIGKSTFAVFLMARVSNGEDMNSKKVREPGRCIYVCDEDDDGGTIKPRAEALGANQENIFKYDNELILSWENSVTKFKEMIEKIRPELVVIDPLVSVLGGRMNMSAANEARTAIKPLIETAKLFGCTILIVRHTTKAVGQKGIHKGQGSIDFSAAARSILLMEGNEENADVGMIFHTKSSLSAEGKTLVFKKSPIFQITGEMGIRYDDLLRDPKRLIALKRIQELIKSGVTESKKIEEDLKDLGISLSTAKRAKKMLGVTGIRDGDVWHSVLPDHQEGQI